MFLRFELALVFIVALISKFIVAAPVNSISPSTLLANGQAAQKLNDLFRTLKVSDPCADNQEACILRSTALCKNGKWQVTIKCPNTLDCFAIPLLTANGTTTTCTSEKNAESVLEAVGAKGGIFGSTNPAVNVPKQFTITRTISPQEASQVLAGPAHTTPASIVPTHTMLKHHRPCDATRPDTTSTPTPSPPPADSGTIAVSHARRSRSSFVLERSIPLQIQKQKLII